MSKKLPSNTFNQQKLEKLNKLGLVVALWRRKKDKQDNNKITLPKSKVTHFPLDLLNVIFEKSKYVCNLNNFNSKYITKISTPFNDTFSIQLRPRQRTTITSSNPINIDNSLKIKLISMDNTFSFHAGVEDAAKHTMAIIFNTAWINFETNGVIDCSKYSCGGIIPNDILQITRKKKQIKWNKNNKEIFTRDILSNTTYYFWIHFLMGMYRSRIQFKTY